MFEKQRYSLYSYSLSGSQPVREISNFITDLSMTTIAPGGYGDLKVHWLVKDRRIIPSDYAIFNRVAMMEGSMPIWLGRWDEPATILDMAQGDMYEGSAMGASAWLQDDPEDASYTNQTALQILTDQLQGATLGRANFLPIDADLSQLLPDNPSATFTYDPQARTVEEVVNDVIGMCGSYTSATNYSNYNWQVQAHPRNKDAAGFPTLQIATQLLNPAYYATVHYTAQLSDIVTENELRPTAEYCFNAITVKYKDGTSTFPNSVTVQDARLNGNKSQGTAPFPYRKLVKDLSSYQLSATQATALANILLQSYMNGGFKVTFKVASVKDAAGHPIPLWRVQAGKMLFIPSLTPQATQLSVVPTLNKNLFYITETKYTEVKDQVPTLEVSAVSFQDRAAFWIARLQYQATTKARTRRHHGHHRAVGDTEVGTVATSWGANAVSTDTYEEGVNFKSVMVNVPASVTLTSAATSNANTPTVTNITQSGFSFRVQPTANGAGFWRGSYKASG